MMWGYYPNPWLMLLWMLVQWLIWLAVIAAIIRVIARRWQNRTGRPFQLFEHLFGGPSPMEILRQRYARGEIDAATFDEMRLRLEASASDVQTHEMSVS
jgi:putative membrane protein